MCLRQLDEAIQTKGEPDISVLSRTLPPLETNGALPPVNLLPFLENPQTVHVYAAGCAENGGQQGKGREDCQREDCRLCQPRLPGSGHCQERRNGEHLSNAAVSSLIATVSLLMDLLTKAIKITTAEGGFGFDLSNSMGTADRRRVGYGRPAAPVRPSPPRHQADH